MPVYCYEAIDPSQGESCCGFERLQAISEPALESCPSCGRPVHRVFAPCAVSVKGRSSTTDAPCASSCSDVSACSLGSTPAERVANLTAGHTCHAGCRH